MEIYVIIFLYLKKERGRIMGSVKFDYSKVIGFINQHEIDCMQSYVDQAHKMIHEKTGLGNDFLGWVDLPKNYNKEEFSRIKKAAEKVKSDSDVLLVIGIGGSYLGARAAIEMASHSFRNNLSKEDRKSPEIYFVGQNISSTYMMDLLDVIKDKVNNGCPLLGICLGMQMLFEEGYEGQPRKGLGFIEGEVKLIEPNEEVKIPHIGWNRLEINKKSKIFNGLNEESFVYYVHSFMSTNMSEDNLIAYSEYGGINIPGMVNKRNIYGAQFHPEKSGEVGLRILKNFGELIV